MKDKNAETQESIAHDDITTRFTHTVGEALIALGLYAACFEAMTLAFRRKTQTFIDLHEPASLAAFERECTSAARIFAYCGPRLVELGALQGNDLVAIKSIRKRRNAFVHASPSHILTLTLSELADDLDVMYEITQKVAYWTVDGSEEATCYPGLRISFDVESTFVTNFARQVASEVVGRYLGQRSRPIDLPEDLIT